VAADPHGWPLRLRRPGIEGSLPETVLFAVESEGRIGAGAIEDLEELVQVGAALLVRDVQHLVLGAEPARAHTEFHAAPREIVQR
jgi:hypothetical protein